MAYGRDDPSDFEVLNGQIEAATGKAYLFKSDYMTETVWLPKSQVEVSWEDPNARDFPKRAEVKVAGWLIRKNDLS